MKVALKRIVTPLLILGSIVGGNLVIADTDPEMDGSSPPCPMHGNAGPMMGFMRRGHGPSHMNPMMGAYERRGMFGGMFGGGQMPPFLRGLNLNEAQRDKVFELLYAQVPIMRTKVKEIQSSRFALHNLALSEQYDENKAKELAENNARAIAEMEHTTASTNNKIYQILTPEQRKYLDARQAHFNQQMEMTEE
jgi:Spy/CpxP family protein refolding chaperone